MPKSALKDKSLFNLVKDINKSLYSHHGVYKLVRGKNFKLIGVGCYKDVYRHKDYPHLCVKTGDLKMGAGKVPVELLPFYLKPIRETKKYQIQHLVTTVNKKNKAKAKKFSQMLEKLTNELCLDIYDFHDQNVGELNGNWYFFDYYSDDK
jgi:hypothetical protein